MIDIKFRVWDTERHEMYYGKKKDCTIATNLFGQTYYCDFLNYNTGDSDRLDYVDSDRLILMQYTGLKDKNGKEIYEGDICKVNTSRGQMTTEIKIPNIWEGVGYRDAKNDMPMNLKVIGNIHENPGLLGD